MSMDVNVISVRIFGCQWMSMLFQWRILDVNGCQCYFSENIWMSMDVNVISVENIWMSMDVNVISVENIWMSMDVNVISVENIWMS